MIDAAPRHRRPPAAPWGIWAALSICGLFFALQVGALDYGTTINNLPHIARYQIKNADAAASAIDRPNLILDKTSYRESLDKQMLRFKLYSVESDEVVNIMALARMKPAELKLDPGFYVYGGGWFYPLGAWYFALAKLGVIEIGPLSAMAAADRMDAVYIYGRLFVLIAVTLSGLVFFAAAVRLVPAGSACLMLGLYFAAPATVMFSEVMKPHWYALLWVNVAILLMLRAYQDHRFGWGASALTGVMLGLAVGSAQTYGLFAVLVWVALLMAAVRGEVRWHHPLVVPLVALVVFLIVNPYAVVNWQGYFAERAKVTTDWFSLVVNPKYVWLFVFNSMLSGLGIAFTLLLLALAIWRLAVGAALDRWMVVGLLFSIVVVGYVSASLSHWHINMRYAPYLPSLAILFVGASLARRRGQWLGLCLLLTLVQAFPLWLAYRDEDSVAHSTRLRAARWVEANIPAGAGLQLGTGQPAPYEVPPIDLARYRLNPTDWRYQVRVERQSDRVDVPVGTTLAARFAPRLTTPLFPFVYSHINPQISIYKRP